jgi:hypothetical protein
MRVRTPYTDAVDELADETRSKQFPDNITPAQALEYVDHDVVCAWVNQELSKRSPQSLLSDAFENLTDYEATSVLNCLINETDTARKLLAGCLREYVAKDIAYDAQCKVEQYDPSDADIDRNNESLMDMARAEGER